jgi:hypothetical protein
MSKTKPNFKDKNLRVQVKSFCPIAESCLYLSFDECLKCFRFFVRLNHANKDN